MNDLWLFVGIIAFLFLIWVYVGGPNRPLSYAGPYLRPTYGAGGLNAEGYGPSANDLREGSYSFWGNWREDATDAIPEATSPYAGQVHIAGGEPSARSAGDEYIVLRSDIDVTITGWQLVSAGSGTQVRIPEGRRSGGRLEQVRLSTGNEVVISSGTSRGEDRYKNVWHVSLGRSADMYEDDTDTVTLLDASGKVVDQYSY